VRPPLQAAHARALTNVVFGWMAELRQALLGPIVGHLVVNLVQLHRLAGTRRDDTVGLLPDED